MSELDLSDSTLLARCIDRDCLAWNKFVERFSDLIFWAIKDKIEQTKYLHSPQDIEDIFQNVFVLLWEKEKLRQVVKRENISVWLTMVAFNCTHNYFRNKKELLCDNELALEKGAASKNCKMDEVVNQEEINGILEEIIARLPAREKIMLKLNYFYNKSHKDISRLLRIPINTVSSGIKRTKEKLKEKLVENER